MSLFLWYCWVSTWFPVSPLAFRGNAGAAVLGDFADTVWNEELGGSPLCLQSRIPARYETQRAAFPPFLRKTTCTFLFLIHEARKHPTPARGRVLVKPVASSVSRRPEEMTTNVALSWLSVLGALRPCSPSAALIQLLFIIYTFNAFIVRIDTMHC